MAASSTFRPAAGRLRRVSRPSRCHEATKAALNAFTGCLDPPCRATSRRTPCARDGSDAWVALPRPGLRNRPQRPPSARHLAERRPERRLLSRSEDDRMVTCAVNENIQMMEPHGVTRRSFMRAAGAAVGSAAPLIGDDAMAATTLNFARVLSTTLSVNGRSMSISHEARVSLLDLLASACRRPDKEGLQRGRVRSLHGPGQWWSGSTPA